MRSRPACWRPRRCYDKGKRRRRQGRAGLGGRATASDEGYQAVARLRLAGRCWSTPRPTTRRSSSSSAPMPEEFEALVADRRGDIYCAAGQEGEAKAEYSKAWQGMERAAEYRRLVEVKLNALGVDPQAPRGRRERAPRPQRKPPHHDSSRPESPRASSCAPALCLAARCSSLRLLAACSGTPTSPSRPNCSANPACSACARPGPHASAAVDFPLAVAVSGDTVDRGRQRRHRGRARRAHRPRALARQRRRAARRRRRQRRHAWPPWSRAATNWSPSTAARCSGARSSPRRRYTAPLVAGGRVFVLAADRSVTRLRRPDRPPAVDAAAPGRDRWCCASPACCWPWATRWWSGMAGRLVGLNPANGTSRWEAPIATPRGTNDVERLVDLVGRVSRVGDIGLRARLPGRRRLRRRRARHAALDQARQRRRGRGRRRQLRVRHRDRRQGRWPGAAPTANAPGPPNACCTAA